MCCKQTSDPIETVRTNTSCAEISFRRATLPDASGIREILGYYIQNTMATWRYEVMAIDVFEGWIRNHQRAERPFWVAEQTGRIIGYSCLSDFRNGEGYWPCAENSVYVRPEYEGLGVGGKLMRLILDDGRLAGLKAVIAAIDSENINSIKFHQKFGFQICGELKDIGQKKDTWRSLTLMQVDLSKSGGT